MNVSQFKFMGVSDENGFPVIQVHLDAKDVSGKAYTKFNKDLAAGLGRYKNHGMINLIIWVDNPHLALPSFGEINKATKTKEGRFLEELLRRIVLVGFENKLIKTVARFASIATGVKVVAVDSLDDAYRFLKLASTGSEAAP